MRRNGSKIAKSINDEYHKMKKMQKKYSSICDQKTCDRCNYTNYCEFYQEKTNERK